ncbi:DNA polymerase eta-like [Hydractinia symbiolongicarpus]|uniref:DNA polymerase eta-like n=1 Tax=Hydractinia symbiolongicarpus TaxID=13093 RepID=UPI00255186C3|nr:DNA polymerase eta-like [Hydractinia symbiolongicarpus]
MFKASTIKKRIVALVDMDCFYVQVAQKKNPALKGKPCAVVQYNAWKGGGIIAVSYEARKCGVTRQMRGDDAKKVCPDIALVPVPESRGKADLTQFRDAGADVIEILAEFCPVIERASVDEAYLDLTEKIDQTLQNYNVEEVAMQIFQDTHIIGVDNIDPKLQSKDVILNSDLFKQWLITLKRNDNFRLAIGAVIASKMRQAVRQKLGFSCSAGIGPNKVLAKVVAGFYKPNQQSLILEENIVGMFESTKIRKVRHLGGKVGALLEEKFKVEYMSELLPISLQELQANVGTKAGEQVYWLCRGIDHEPVRVRQLTQSVGCGKNFRGAQKLKTKADVYKWLGNFADEIVERLEKDKQQNNRVATQITAGCVNDQNQSQSRRCSVLRITSADIQDEAFRVLSEFNKSSSTNEWSPGLINLNLCASKFQDIATPGVKSINSYMTAETAATALANHDRKNVPVLERKSSPKKKSSVAISNYFAATTRKFNSESGCNKIDAPTLGTKMKNRLLSHSEPNEESSGKNNAIDTHDKTREKSSPANFGQNLFSRFCSTTETSTATKRSRGGSIRVNDRISNICEDVEGNIVSPNCSGSIQDLSICEKCGKRVLVWDLPEHMDFHFAKDLQDSMRKDFLNLYSNKRNENSNGIRNQASNYTNSPLKKKTKTDDSFRKYFSAS